MSGGNRKIQVALEKMASGVQPFTADYAKTSRASCRQCRRKIKQDVLRLATFPTGAPIASWYHVECFFRHQRPNATREFKNFDSLAPHDQRMLREKIEALESDDDADVDDELIQEFGVEKAPSGRAQCRGCFGKIEKDVARIKKVSFETEGGWVYGGQALWYHVACFASERQMLGYFQGGVALPGYRKMNAEDQDTIKRLLPILMIAKPNLSSEPQTSEQRDLLAEFRSKIADGNLTHRCLQVLLQCNNQRLPKSEEATLDRVCDMLAYGALNPCTKCGGQLTLQGNMYVCEGRLTERLKCDHTERMPTRQRTNVPPVLRNGPDFLQSYQCVVGHRLLPD